VLFECLEKRIAFLTVNDLDYGMLLLLEKEYNIGQLLDGNAHTLLNVTQNLLEDVCDFLELALLDLVPVEHVGDHIAEAFGVDRLHQVLRALRHYPIKSIQYQSRERALKQMINRCRL
jgi:hypothetical protein